MFLRLAQQLLCIKSLCCQKREKPVTQSERGMRWRTICSSNGQKMEVEEEELFMMALCL